MEVEFLQRLANELFGDEMLKARICAFKEKKPVSINARPIKVLGGYIRAYWVFDPTEDTRDAHIKRLTDENDRLWSKIYDIKDAVTKLSLRGEGEENG